MKKIYLALLCMASLVIGTACSGDKKADNEKGKKTETEVKEDQAEDETEQANEEEQQDKKDPKKSEIELTVEKELSAELQEFYDKGEITPCLAVFFKDDLQGEAKGDCPSKWELKHGTAEVKTWKDVPAIFMSNNDTEIQPIVAGEEKNWLPDVFTIDFDYFCNGTEEDAADNFNATYHVQFFTPDEEWLGEVGFESEVKTWWNLRKTNEENLQGENPIEEFEKKIDWNHVTISFNKDVMKVYVNGNRVANLPKLVAPAYFTIRGEGWDDHRYYIKNFRLATSAPEE